MIAYPQILFNPQKQNQSASLDLVWTEYSKWDSIGYICYLNLPLTEVAPTYAFDMGQETPVPICVKRAGCKVLGPEDYKTFDYDSTELIYRLSLHSPGVKYKIRITIKVKVLKGTIAVLSGLEIHTEIVGGGGPQGEEAQISRPFFFARLYPNPARGLIKIKFNSPDERGIRIRLYGVSGRLVQEKSFAKSKIGMNEVLIRPEGLSAGVYFVQLETLGYNKTEKVILLK